MAKEPKLNSMTFLLKHISHFIHLTLYGFVICLVIDHYQAAHSEILKRNFSLNSDMRLQIDAPCLEHIEILNTKKTPKHLYQIESNNISSFDIGLMDARTVVIKQKSCRNADDLRKQHLQPDSLTLLIPTDVSIAINAPYKTNMHIEPHTGYLSLLSQNGDVVIDECRQLNLATGGYGHISVKKLLGEATLSGSGEAKTTIDFINSPALSANLNQKSSLFVNKGHLKAIAIETASSSDIHYDGNVNFAWVHLLGAGNVFVNQISGAVAAQRDGYGKLDVLRPPLSPSFKGK